jgi:uncharacterized protein YjbJ (UPF0337 family)
MADKTTAQQMQFNAKVDDMKGRLKEAWGDLTDDDVTKSEGQWDQMIATIREKTGESLETVTTKVNELIDNAQGLRK